MTFAKFRILSKIKLDKIQTKISPFLSIILKRSVSLLLNIPVLIGKDWVRAKGKAYNLCIKLYFQRSSQFSIFNILLSSISQQVCDTGVWNFYEI